MNRIELLWCNVKHYVIKLVYQRRLSSINKLTEQILRDPFHGKITPSMARLKAMQTMGVHLKLMRAFERIENKH